MHRILLGVPLALALVVAGCSAPRSGSRPCVEDDLRAWLKDPAISARALEVTEVLGDPSLRDAVEPLLTDPDTSIQLRAWMYLLKVCPEAEAPEIICNALRHASWYVRSAALQATQTRALEDPEVDASLERCLREETIGRLLERAAENYALRHPADGARQIYEILDRRGPLWPSAALSTFVKQPDRAFEAVFRSELDSQILERRILGARGLRALGLIPDGDPLAMLASRPIDADFLQIVQQIDSGHGAVEESSWDKLIQKACRAQVIILGETHMSAFDGAAQAAIIAELSARRVHTSLKLLYERPMQEMQRIAVGAMEIAGGDAELIESEPIGERTAHERDIEARTRISERAKQEPDRQWVVLYGDMHRASFSRALRAQGIDPVVITTSATPEMLAAVWRRAGTVKVRGRVFQFADETWYIAARPVIEDLLDRSSSWSGVHRNNSELSGSPHP